ncbi:hypothetical protein QR680_015803 [Steinernema hermaphroditum]|uniref:Uncharacterized protein n=1 Tax=Steinernema hermaphroditum TaxID=289476 RepID=A0AA39H901_9BILA|nr:hypothetical protein QR680_015803 [Steinernema hermaphroditum]
MLGMEAGAVLAMVAAFFFVVTLFVGVLILKTLLCGVEEDVERQPLKMNDF